MFSVNPIPTSPVNGVIGLRPPDVAKPNTSLLPIHNEKKVGEIDNACSTTEIVGVVANFTK